MAISPPSDIVLDVVRAADPGEVAAARAQLETFGTVRRTQADAFGPLATETGPRLGRDGPPTASRTAPGSEAFTRFEAMVLQTFLQSMMPEGTQSVYGGGLSGDMWKAILAEKLGDVMAKRGGIGIADRLLADHYVEDKKRVAIGPLSQGPDKERLDRQDMLSAALVQELQRRVAQGLDEDRAAASGVGS